MSKLRVVSLMEKKGFPPRKTNKKNLDVSGLTSQLITNSEATPSVVFNTDRSTINPLQSQGINTENMLSSNTSL
jgi:hypothetical protein